MNIKEFLKTKLVNLNISHLSIDNDFSDYTTFKKFIDEHYKLEYLKKNNYIKYVKVVRQILIIERKEEYSSLFTNIDDVINILASHQTFPRINIRKYMFKIDAIFNIIKSKHSILIEIMKHIKSLDPQSNPKIAFSMNTVNYRYQIFKKYSVQLKEYLQQFINLEKEHGIDHKFIELNNLERSLIGKKSEYVVNNIIEEYVRELNCNSSEKTITYFYETNVNLMKLLSIKSTFKQVIKGEIDGLIISFDGDNYVIEYIIEVKSSIKATFEDTHKFVSLQKYIIDMFMDFSNIINIIYDKYTFTSKSFSKIHHKHMSEWVIYICINDNNYTFIEKSHFYFLYVFKIIDNNFIDNFYCKKNDDSILEKYELLIKNNNYVNGLFDKWISDVNLYNNSNIYINK
jgi:hypothetical protein